MKLDLKNGQESGREVSLEAPGSGGQDIDPPSKAWCEPGRVKPLICFS